MSDPLQPLERAVLLAVQLPGVDDVAFQSSVAELDRLARTLGLQVVGRVTQRRASLDPGTVVGSGKLATLKTVIGGGALVEAGAGAAAADDADAESEDAPGALDGSEDDEHDE